MLETARQVESLEYAGKEPVVQYAADPEVGDKEIVSATVNTMADTPDDIGSFSNVITTDGGVEDKGVSKNSDLSYVFGPGASNLITERDASDSKEEAGSSDSSFKRCEDSSTPLRQRSRGRRRARKKSYPTSQF